MKNPWLIVGIIAILLLGGAVLYSSVLAGQSNEGIEIKTHIKGNSEADITLVEYSDFQCSACAGFEPIINGMLEQYGDRLRFEYKQFPLPPQMHPYSLQAAMAAEAAGQQGNFFEFHDKLYENQQAWSSSATPITFFLQYASDLGLDMDKFKLQMKSSVLREKIEADFAEGEALGVDGTPTFFLNGKRMKYESYLEFMQQIGYTINPDLVSSSIASTTETSTKGVRFGF
jgi:protein-disulfide isomerase